MEELFAFICVVIAVAFSAVGVIEGRGRERERAIQAGAAYYTVDPATGDTEFKYIKEKEDEK